MRPDHEHPAAGLDLGYARVSTTKQSLMRQIDALNAAGIPDEQIWVDKKTGASVLHVGLLCDYPRRSAPLALEHRDFDLIEVTADQP